jgi:small multidrug resistance family-3 protein
MGYARRRMNPLAVVPLFVVTAIAEIAGCYLVFLWMKGGRSPLLLVGAAVALGAFAWLLSFHPNAGRAYAAYGGVYVAAAVVWGWVVEGHPPDRWDLIGAAVCLIGMATITFGPRP